MALCFFLAECSVVGDVFVTTFDGRMFLQPGACQYVLAKSRTGRFTVTLQYTTCAEVLCVMANIHINPAVSSLQRCNQPFCMVCVSTAASVHSVYDSGVG